MKKSKVTKIRKELKKVNTPPPKKHTTLKFMIILVVLLGILSALGYAIYTNKFDVSKVTIKGNTKYTTEEISKTINVKGKNILTVSIGDIENKLKIYPYIGKAITYKKLPNEIYITIEERKPKYYILNSKNNEIVILDEIGIALESIKAEVFAQDNPLIKGMVLPEKIKYGEKINEVEYSKIIAIQHILDEYENKKIDRKITTIDFDAYKIILTLDDKLKVVIEDNKELEYKMRFLKNILLKVDDSEAEIDMTLDSPLYKK